MPTCNTDSLIASCSQFTNISPKNLQAQIVYVLMLELAALGGTSYTLDSLNQTSGTALIGMDTPKLIAAELALDINNATAAGASVPGFQDRMTQIACFMALDDQTLLRMKTFLLCQLGKHATVS